MAKKLLTLFMLLALFFGVGRAETVTVTKTMNEVVAENDFIPFSGSDINDITTNNICLQFSLADNIAVSANALSVFWGTSPTEWRVYGSSSSAKVTISVSPEIGTLQSVTITYSDASTAVLTYNGNDVPSGTPCAVNGSFFVQFSLRSATADSGQPQVGITSISVTYETKDRVVGDWHQIRGSAGLGVEHYEYIIMNSENTKVAGSYENGHFTALPCEGNVVICDDDNFENRTVKVTGDGVKIFTIEGNDADGFYLKDTDGNYYSIDENGNIVVSKQLLSMSSNSGIVNIVNPTDYHIQIGYDTDEFYFGTYYHDSPYIDNNRSITMYYRTKPMTLKEAIENEHTGLFVISNELQVAKVVKRISGPISQDQVPFTAALLCKDDGPACDASDMSIISENCEDYMTAHVGFNGDWDQSNWVTLMMPAWSMSDLDKAEACEGMRLAANSITVMKQRDYFGRARFTALAYANDLVIAEGSQHTTYTPNLYCPANFLRENHNGNATGYDAEGNPTENHYFFMNPKREEFCEITYAVWTIREDNYGKYGAFVLPAPDGTNNPAGIAGAVRVKWELNNDPVIDFQAGTAQEWPAGMEEGAMYRCLALVKNPISIKKVSEDASAVDTDTYYEIYPFDFDPVEHVITGIKDVVDVIDKTVAGVKYYNLAGIESDRPFEGVNIIVTTYTDGSRSSSKVLK